jgi:hypothetical protein
MYSSRYAGLVREETALVALRQQCAPAGMKPLWLAGAPKFAGARQRPKKC